MSEYQHYEFQAIDRPLSAADQRELRALSSRAEITSGRFVNTYNWGNLRGDPEEMLLRWFDAYLYVSNFGSYQLSFRVPRGAVQTEDLLFYAHETLSYREEGEHLVIHFRVEEEEPSDWFEHEDLLGQLIPLREALVAGDRRSLYLAWLFDVQMDRIEEDDEEPPVPPGLNERDAALEALVELLHLDRDLLDVAAEASEPLKPRAPRPEDVLEWLAAREGREKDEWLRQVFDGDGKRLGFELRRRFSDEHPEARPERMAPRTVSDLVDRAERLGAERRAEAERRRRGEARREAERREAARKRHLDALAGREEELWDRALGLIAATKPKAYDEAAELLADLRDLAARGGGTAAWAARVDALRAKYPKRAALLKRLDRLGV